MSVTDAFKTFQDVVNADITHVREARTRRDLFKGAFGTEDDVKEYFKTEMDTEDYSEYVAQYGYGYIYRAVTFNNVGQYLQEQNPAPAYTDISEIIVPAATDDTTAEENTETPAA